MRFIKLNSCTSTNEEAFKQRKLIDKKQEFAIITDYQFNGRGLSKNEWISEKGKNLLISIVCYPSFLSPLKQFYFSMTIALAVKEAIEKLGVKSQIKWPNDILTENKKIAGILIESEIKSEKIRCIVAGVGININQVRFPEFSLKATSVKNQTNTEFEIDYVASELNRTFHKWYQILKDENYAKVKQEYLSNLMGFGEFLTYHTDRKKVKLKIIDILHSGHILTVTKQGNKKEYDLKEIQLLL